MQYLMGDSQSTEREEWEKNIRTLVEQMKPYGVAPVVGTSEKLEQVGPRKVSGPLSCARNVHDGCHASQHLTKALEVFERLGNLIEPDKLRKELADLPQ